MRAGALPMKPQCLGPVLLAVALLASATTPAQGPYVEVRTGLAQVDSMSDTDGNARGEIEYGGATVYGIEAGMRSVFDTPFAVSLSFDTFLAEPDSATFDSGSSSGEIADVLHDFDQRATLLSVNGFYEHEMEDQKLYAGLGIAGASIGNAGIEFGLALHMGLRYEIKPLGYLNARVTWFRSDGPPHKATGLEFEKFEYIGITLGFGMDLWQ